MDITSEANKKIVIDYDILLDSGMHMPMTIDESTGDSFNMDGDCIVITLAPKESPQVKERIIIFKTKVASIQIREREVTEMTLDQKKAWKKTLQEMSKSTH